MFDSSKTRLMNGLWRLTRRAIVAGGLVLGIAAAGLTGAAAQTAVKVGKSAAESFSFMPVHIGHEVGIFQKHGLDVQIIDFGGGTRLQQALASGAVDIGLGSGPELASAALGSPVKGIGMFMGPPSLMVLLARNDDTVTDLESLKGRRIAVTQLNALTAWLARRLSVLQGWGPEGFDLVAVGDDQSRIAALRTSQVDAILVNLATALAFEKRGDGKIVAKFSDYIKVFHNHVMYATDDIIKNNPEAVRAFVAGWIEAIEWMNANREKTIEMVKDRMVVDTDVGLVVFDIVMPTMTTDLHFDPEALELLAESWVEMGTLPNMVDTSTLYTEEFLP